MESWECGEKERERERESGRKGGREREDMTVVLLFLLVDHLKVVNTYYCSPAISKLL